MGCQVATASDGGKTLELYKNQNFDTILMDIHMPGISGLEFTRRIRTLERKEGGYTSIIAMTASAMRKDREECMEAGMDDYISKPFVIEEIDKVLKKASWKNRGQNS